jgi:hypothetical protein
MERMKIPKLLWERESLAKSRKKLMGGGWVKREMVLFRHVLRGLNVQVYLTPK